MEKTIVKLIIERTNISKSKVKSTLDLLADGATIPFIARYRKEQTGSLDEVQIKLILDVNQLILDLIARKSTVQKSIEDQGKWTEELARKINQTWDAQTLEDIYLPFKRKRKTKADKAREFGLEPLAKIIMAQHGQNVEQKAREFINQNIKSVDEALQGARHIISEWMNEDIGVRNRIRKQYERTAVLIAKLIKSKKEDAEKYKDYWDYEEALKRAPSHRLLAIRRAEEEGLLRVSIKVDDELAIQTIERQFLKNGNNEHISLAAEDAWKRLISPSIENEFAKSSKLKADKEAIDVFAENLRQLLLEPPLGQKRILAIDPGFRTGSKIAVLDSNGDFKQYATIFPHPPQNKTSEAAEIVEDFISKYKIEAIAIGNGTAGRETEKFIKQTINGKYDIDVFLISEAGASIYSASEIAREEFPNLDLTIRGAISIGRRLLDPLAELVKIDPKSIGVGQYQHDVQQDLLRDSLNTQVISSVNKVGINLNTASAQLLSYVSGIGPVLARNIVDFRTQNGNFDKRNDLKKVKGLGPKAFEQAAGFLRIKKGKNPLDDSAIHPERYSLITRISKDQQVALSDLVGNQDLIKDIPWKNYADNEVGIPTLLDISKELAKPGLDPRGEIEVFNFAKDIHNITDLYVDMKLPGIVTNLTKFGAFVDIGIKENGLVHISQITDKFIKDPSEVLKLGQKIEVRIVGIDLDRKRIQLSMKNLTK